MESEMIDYTLDRISAELDVIFGFDPIPACLDGIPTDESRPTLNSPDTNKLVGKTVDLGPPFFFGRSLTPREGVLLHSIIFTSLGEEDKFLKDVIRYWRKKDDDASRAKTDKEKRTKRKRR